MMMFIIALLIIYGLGLSPWLYLPVVVVGIYQFWRS